MIASPSSTNTTLSIDVNRNLRLQITTATNSSRPLSTVPNGCIVMNYTVSRDNADDVISNQITSIFDLAVYGVILPLLFLISAPTNVINMAVFYKLGLSERINLCLFWRSCVDFLDITLSYLRECDIFPTKFQTAAKHGVITYFYIQTRFIFVSALCWVSAFTTTIIACERCFCVVSPFHSRRFMKTKTMIVIFALLFIFIMGLSYTVMMQWTMTCAFIPETNTTLSIMYNSEEYFLNRELIDTLQGTVLGTIFPAFCIIVVTVCTTITAIYLRKMGAWRQHSTTAADSMTVRELSLTRTLVSLSVLFIVCYSSAFIVLNANRGFPEIRIGGRYSNTYRFLSTCKQLSFFINASFHFFVYYSTGSKYRHAVRDLFNSLKVKPKTKNSRELTEKRFIP